MCPRLTPSVTCVLPAVLRRSGRSVVSVPLQRHGASCCFPRASRCRRPSPPPRGALTRRRHRNTCRPSLCFMCHQYRNKVLSVFTISPCSRKKDDPGRGGREGGSAPTAWCSWLRGDPRRGTITVVIRPRRGAARLACTTLQTTTGGEAYSESQNHTCGGRLRGEVRRLTVVNTEANCLWKADSRCFT